MSERSRALGGETLRDELVVAVKRAVQERDVGRFDRCAQRVVDIGKDWCEEQTCALAQRTDLKGDDRAAHVAAPVVAGRTPRHRNRAYRQLPAYELLGVDGRAERVEGRLEPAMRRPRERREGRLRDGDRANGRARAQHKPMRAVLA